MPYVLFNALTGDVIGELEPDDGLAAAFILPAGDPPPPPDLPWCPPVVRPGWCEPPTEEACALPPGQGLPADCECIVFDDGLTVFDGGFTVFVCPDE